MQKDYWCKDYWTGMQGYLESYKDVHPAIVCSENNDVEVYVHKGMNGLPRVAMSEYFSSSIHEREQQNNVQTSKKAGRCQIGKREAEEGRALQGERANSIFLAQ